MLHKQGASHTRMATQTSVWVREMAKTLLNKSEDGSEPGQLEYDVVQSVSRCGYEVCSRNLEGCFLIFQKSAIF